MLKSLLNSAPQSARAAFAAGPAAISPSVTIDRTKVGLSEEEKTRRGKVIEEIIVTEQSFNNSLRVVATEFVPCLKQTGQVTDAELRTIVGNVVVLYELSNRLLKELEDEKREPEETRDIGGVFHRLAPFFKLFAEYCDEHPNRVKMVSEVLGGREKVRAALHELQTTKKLQSLNSYLIMPIQRVPRYVLLLEELTKKDEDDTSKARRALEGMRNVANHINESLRNRENAQKLLEIQNSIVDPAATLKSAFSKLAPRRASLESETMEDSQSLFNHGRVFIRQADLILTSSSSSPQTPSNTESAESKSRAVPFGRPQSYRRVFLFSDQLIHGMLYGKSTVLSPMRIVPSKVTLGQKDSTFIISSSSTSYIFKCNTEEEARSWVQDVDKVIERINENAKNQVTTTTTTKQEPPKKPVANRPPKQCQSCHRRFASSPTESILSVWMKRSTSQGEPFAGKCVNCQRALCSSCCCSGSSDAIRCAPCEVLKIAQQQTLTSLDDQEKRIIEELGRIKSHHISSQKLMFGTLIALLVLLLYVAFLKPDAVFQGTIGLFIQPGGESGQGIAGRITFSSASSRFDWDFSEEATIATAKTLMLEEA